MCFEAVQFILFSFFYFLGCFSLNFIFFCLFLLFFGKSSIYFVQKFVFLVKGCIFTLSTKQ